MLCTTMRDISARAMSSTYYRPNQQLYLDLHIQCLENVLCTHSELLLLEKLQIFRAEQKRRKQIKKCSQVNMFFKFLTNGMWQVG